MTLASTIAVSGLQASALRLQKSALNIANSLSYGPLPEATRAGSFPPAYTPMRVNQASVSGGGTRAVATAVSPASIPAFDPSAPIADANGMVASPNVDLANEFTQLLIARYTFAANALVIRADAEMRAHLLNITA